MKPIWVIALAALAAACGKHADDSLQGYAEADYIYLASQESGVVAELFVREGDRVDAGAPVFRLEPDRLGLAAQSAAASRAALADAVEAAQANAVLARTNYGRSLELYERGFMPRARLDSDRAARDAANARLEQARRELAGAQAESGLARERLSDLQGAAPAAGAIERIFHRPGEVAAAGDPIASLLTPDNMKVRFFAPEAYLSRLRMGAQVNVSCDGCASNITARISFIATEPQFTPPVIYSLERRDKLVYLVEARLDQPGAVRPGMPVTIALRDEP